MKLLEVKRTTSQTANDTIEWTLRMLHAMTSVSDTRTVKTESRTKDQAVAVVKLLEVKRTTSQTGNKTIEWTSRMLHATSSNFKTREWKIESRTKD